MCRRQSGVQQHQGPARTAQWAGQKTGDKSVLQKRCCWRVSCLPEYKEQLLPTDCLNHRETRETLQLQGKKKKSKWGRPTGLEAQSCWFKFCDFRSISLMCLHHAWVSFYSWPQGESKLPWGMDLQEFSNSSALFVQHLSNSCCNHPMIMFSPCSLAPWISYCHTKRKE